MQAVDFKRPPTVTHDAPAVLCDAAGQPKKLQQLVAEAPEMVCRFESDPGHHDFKGFLPDRAAAVGASFGAPLAP